ncbi:hypothetical protein SLEP1_g17481 [Rubroshorea leprosula]|uniref:Uncharacterized protein n=1 Tax=Rubroshorea leprosula TaxID=152421 RepID=A0AAV5J0B4_9ROSI|nr:hypothetical protein SLEP1_g17481 [Rubroshorea leprosula]
MQVLLLLHPTADLSPCKICFFFFAKQSIFLHTRSASASSPSSRLFSTQVLLLLLRQVAGLSPCEFFLFSAQQPTFLHHDLFLLLRRTRVPCSSSPPTLCNPTSPPLPPPISGREHRQSLGISPYFLVLEPRNSPPLCWKFQICSALSSLPAALACGCDFRSFLPCELPLQIAASFSPLLGPVLQLLNSGIVIAPNQKSFSVRNCTSG